MDDGNYYQHHEYYDQAIKLYERAIEFQKMESNDDVEFIGMALNKIFDCYFCLKRYNKLMEIIQRINELKQPSNDTNFLRGLINYFYLNNPKEALDDFDKSLKFDPSKEKTRWMRELCLKSINGRLQRQNYSDLAKVLYDTAWNYYTNGEYQKVELLAEEAIDYEKNGQMNFDFIVNAMDLISGSCFWSNKADKGIHILNEMIDINPSCASYFNSRANFYYFLSKDFKSSLRDANEAIRLDPSDEEARDMRKMCLEELDKEEEEEE